MSAGPATKMSGGGTGGHSRAAPGGGWTLRRLWSGNLRRWLLFTLALSVLVEVAMMAWLSPRRPDVAIPGAAETPPAPAWAWLRYPLELNAARRLPVLTGDWLSISFAPDGRHGWLLGAGDVLLTTANGGDTWARIASPGVAVANATGAPADGDNRSPTVAASTGATAPEVNALDYDYEAPAANPVQQAAPNALPPQAVQRVRTEADLAGSKGNALPVPAPAARGAVQVVRLDPLRGYMLRGTGAVWFTADAGATWARVTGLEDATALAASRGGSVWALVPKDGAVALNAEGGTVGAVRYGSGNALPAEFLLGAESGDTTHYPLHVGREEVWLGPRESLDLARVVLSLRLSELKQQTSIPPEGFDPARAASLADAMVARGDSADGVAAFSLWALDAQRSWLTGPEGGLWRGFDSGARWYRAALAPEEAALARAAGTYWWLPPVWALFALGAIAGLVMLAWSAPPSREPAEESVEDVLLSDRPLEPGDPDALGFASTAAGLSNFIRNERTEPPLTLAVTGEWGSGKSSLMNLLRGDLEARGLRPVWFNAWHHQTEQRLLAALLENVRAQAVPGWLSAGGLAFRGRLLRTRIAAERARWIALAAVLLFSTGFLVTSDRLTLATLSTLARPFTELPGVGDWLGHAFAAVTGQTPAQAAATQPAADTVEQGGLLTAIVAGLLALWRIIAALRAFGVQPASLLAVSAGSAKLKDLSAQTSFRYAFAREFGEVTAALGARRLVIFIDDVDRCRPDEAYEILEAANFLVSSGACFVVLGLARQRVEQAVGLVFADQAAAQEGGDTPQARQRFAKAYLEKLINIEVPVPAPREQALRGLFERRAQGGAAAQARAGERWMRLVAAGGLAVCLLGGLGLGSLVWRQNRSDGSEGASAGTSVAGPEAAMNGADASGAMEFVPASAELGAVAIVAPWLALVGLLGAALIGVAAWRLSTQPALVVRDSASFTEALNRWLPLLARRPGTTPRRLKRFVNRVRFYAMMQRGVRPEPTVGGQLAAWIERHLPAVPWLRRLGRWLAGPATGGVPADGPRDGQLTESELIALTAALEMDEGSNGDGPLPEVAALRSEVADVPAAARARFADLVRAEERATKRVS